MPDQTIHASSLELLLRRFVHSITSAHTGVDFLRWVAVAQAEACATEAVLTNRIVPSSRRRHVRDLGRAPCVRRVGIDGRAFFQDGIDNAPRLLDVIFARE